MFIIAVAEVGDDVSSLTDDGAIVLCNHQATGDLPTLLNAFNYHGNVIDQIMFIADKKLKYDYFGLMSQCRGDFFVQKVRVNINYH